MRKSDRLLAPATAVTAPLANWTEPPEPGSTTPFNQEALDAIKAGSGCWVWSSVLSEWLFVVLLLLPQTLLLLGLLGAVDAWVDIRARIAARLEPSNHFRS